MNTFTTFVIIILLAGWSSCAEENKQSDSVHPLQEAVAEVTDPAKDHLADPILQGKQTYDTYCASCHGENARGNGPAIVTLSEAPKDLTQLSRDNDGTFPTEKVYQSIDGRIEFLAHGTREMPIWGNIWSEQDKIQRPEGDITREISEVVEYLRSIQE